MQLMNVMTAVATATPAPSHFSGDPKTLSSGSLRTPPAHSGPATQAQDVVVFSDDSDAICCIPHPIRDLLLNGRYCRFAFSQTVAHFRKK